MMKGQKGITLVALIITIIVMLILVAVTVTVALDGGLIGKTQEAKQGWESADDDVEDLDTTVQFKEGSNTYTGINAIVNGDAS